MAISFSFPSRSYVFVYRQTDVQTPVCISLREKHRNEINDGWKYLQVVT